jgi:glycoprotein-N-acetylgalactosamine 3-beta-galactosyltransferase
MILTSKKNLESRVSITYDAWAHKCDDHDFVLLIPGEENKIGQRIEKKINNAFNLLQPEGLLNDSYNQLTDKVYHMFMDTYKYKKKYDWYIKCDDDTFLFVDNLRQFLHDKNSSEAVSYGYDFKVKVKNGYHSGGAGYVLSGEAFERLGSALLTNYSFCPNSGTEDIDCISCLESLGVKKGKSTDTMGKETFFPQNILDFVYGTKIEWLKEYAKNPVPIKVEFFYFFFS